MPRNDNRCSPDQIVKTVQEVEAMTSAGKTKSQVFQAIAIMAATRERWKKHWSGVKSDEDKRLRE